jgi:hypothetical protein
MKKILVRLWNSLGLPSFTATVCAKATILVQKRTSQGTSSQVIALIGLSSEKDLTHSKSILEEREQEREIHTPDCFNTGRGSPVRLDSSTVLLPPVTTPSTGMRSCQI